MRAWAHTQHVQRRGSPKMGAQRLLHHRRYKARTMKLKENSELQPMVQAHRMILGLREMTVLPWPRGQD